MNDDQIKNIISRDKAITIKPANEWVNIQSKIEESDSKFSFSSFFMPGSVALVCFLTWFLWSPESSNVLQNEDSLVADFSEISNYLNETEEFYTWID